MLETERSQEGLVRIRRFVTEDWDRLKEIEAASTRYVTPLESLLHFYEVPSEGFLVAEIGGRPVGYAVGNLRILRDGRLEGHVLDIAVSPTVRRKGVGTALVACLQDMFRDKGAEGVGLEVKSNNADARKFYTRLGFMECYLARGYYRMRGYSEDGLQKSLRER